MNPRTQHDATKVEPEPDPSLETYEVRRAWFHIEKAVSLLVRDLERIARRLFRAIDERIDKRIEPRPRRRRA